MAVQLIVIYVTAKIIAELDARANALGLKMYIICRAVGIAPSTWTRWKKGAEARINSVAALDAELSRLEKIAS